MFGIWPHCIIHMATTLVQGWEPSSPNCTNAIAFWQVSLLLFMPSPPMSPAPTGILNQAARVMLWKHWSYHITTLLHMSYLRSSPPEGGGKGKTQHHCRIWPPPPWPHSLLPSFTLLQSQASTLGSLHLSFSLLGRLFIILAPIKSSLKCLLSSELYPNSI